MTKNKVSLAFGAVAGIVALPITAIMFPFTAAAAMSVGTVIGAAAAMRATLGIAKAFDDASMEFDGNAALALGSYVLSPAIGAAGGIAGATGTLKYVVPLLLL